MLFVEGAARGLHRDGGLQCRVALIVGDLEIVIDVVEQRGWLSLQDETRRGERRARKLRVNLREMVAVKVAVPARPDEVTHFKIALLRDHVRQQRVRRDIEGTPRKMSALRWYSWQESCPSAT